jgi:hypothetical protein
MKHKNVNPRQRNYWLGDDGKHYRVAGFRCINKETEKEIGGKW